MARHQPLPNGMLAAKAAYETFVRFAERVERVTGKPFADLDPDGDGRTRSTMTVGYAEFLRRFVEHMDDDFNTGGAVGVLFELVNKLNKQADDGKLEDPTAADREATAEFAEGATLLREFAGILGLTFAPEQATLGGDDQLVAGLMQLLIDLRNNLRATAKGAAQGQPARRRRCSTRPT